MQFALFVEQAMIGQNQMGTVANEQIFSERDS
jgi:hypothetical protein